nr:hypothetical protein [Escherichia coli]
MVKERVYSLKQSVIEVMTPTY